MTVGLFTYQRPSYLKRQLSFFKVLNIPFRVIVLDGSETKESADLNKAICSEFNHEYIREVSLQARHVILNDMLDTDFIAYAADDDLITPDFYMQAIEFLKLRPEYSVVSGELLTLHYFRKYPRLGYYFRNFLQNKYDFHQGDFLEQLIRRDQSYQLGCPPTYYAVRRSEVHQTFSKYIMSIKQYSSMERLEAISNCIHGGMKVIDSFLGFRDYSIEATRNPQRDDPHQYICDEDIATLKTVIRHELKDRVKSKILLEYYASYAWPLPVRVAQGEIPAIESKYRLAFECIKSKYLSSHENSFERKVGKALAIAQRELL